ncbi:hypothetical protein D3093_17070 (plasmid) [Azospirillum argentinense]|uniref:Uncharacterized protein n=1 Tax=Azospirillum argentinense TaxID=2970906 RepID=A0A4D8PIB0_9PROT|nr:hypothetical protein [Azospirillum argentinense]QCN97010.1 hypothetical protein D3093_17070 [Azospirillum argentinense]
MAGSENTTTLPTESTTSGPVHELGRWLGAIIAEARRNDVPRAGLDWKTLATLDAREQADNQVRGAIEHLVMSTKATTLADAAVHAMLIRYIADDVEAAVESKNRHAAERNLWLLERLGRSIFDVLVEVSGINPTELPADTFLRDAATLWPVTSAGDLFAATAGLLEAEAGRLAAEPTPAMVEAGASAAGITADLARKVWGAMAGAAHPAGA